MNRTASFVRLLPALGLALVLPAIALAADPHASPTPLATLPFWPNFLLYLIVFYFLLRKPAVRGWAARREGLRDAILAGERELAAAQESLQTARQRRATLEDDVQSLSSQIANDADQEARKILRDAEERANRIESQTELSLAAEEKAVESRIRKELADYVVAEARRRLQSEIDSNVDRTIRQSALGGLKGLLQ